jgi:hypothetical protein
MQEEICGWFFLGCKEVDDYFVPLPERLSPVVSGGLLLDTPGNGVDVVVGGGAACWPTLAWWAQAQHLGDTGVGARGRAGSGTRRNRPAQPGAR